MKPRNFESTIIPAWSMYPAAAHISEDPTSDFVWRELRLCCDVPEIGRSLFKGSVAQVNEQWREFRNLIQIAETYYRSAVRVEGSAAALPYYYCMLNLAKAELLVRTPKTVLNTKITHGLSFSPETSRTLRSDVIRVQGGVFKYLYESRTGQTLATGLQLPLKRLLSNCPEIGWELPNVGYVSAAAPTFHSVVANDTHAWSVLAIAFLEEVSASDVSLRRLREHFEEVESPDHFRELFDFNPRVHSANFRFFQTRKSHLMPMKTGDNSPISQFADVALQSWASLAPIIDISWNLDADAYLCPSLYKSRLVSMPSWFARYAVMFYVSSIVRYKPSQLDRRDHGDQAWLLDAFTPQAALPLLIGSLSSIRNRQYRFMRAATYRT